MKRVGKISLVSVFALAITVMFVYMFSIAFAVPISGGDISAQLGSYTGAGSGQSHNIKASLDLAHIDLDTVIVDTGTTLDQRIHALMGSGTGSVWYCDSGESSGTEDGTTWATATDTLDEAVNLCTANVGDIILVAPGHAETFTAQDLDLDSAGVIVIGLGHGSLRPTITYNHANAEVAIGADNVIIKNVRFLSSITDVLMGIEVEDGVSYFTISDCVFDVDSAGTDEFAECINFVNANVGCVIEDCYFNMKAGGAVAAILLDADTDQLMIRNNFITGDYSTASITGDTTASTDLWLIDNIIINGALIGDGGLNAQPAIELLDSTGGLCNRNVFGSDVATGLAIRVADDMTFIDNWIADSDGDDKAGAIESTSATVTIFVDGG